MSAQPNRFAELPSGYLPIRPQALSILMVLLGVAYSQAAHPLPKHDGNLDRALIGNVLASQSKLLFKSPTPIAAPAFPNPPPAKSRPTYRLP
jgi:hypothetical protein